MVAKGRMHNPLFPALLGVRRNDVNPLNNNL